MPSVQVQPITQVTVAMPMLVYDIKCRIDTATTRPL
eukprot:CAMPEP_0117673860 /NCGR_PEP_ID=MMETSP0804-20121206/14712_1 /TAXON_ID=1074897 /ORGANISM="Tetraselmis astigmatica, Strain CCMP880" /LENGTH=35 /DNA_ID= /DNA_START= /DNA_END= /DNA_ORIENTATION=